MNRRRRSLVGWSVVVLVAGGVLMAVRPREARAAQDAKGVAFFETKIRPVLAKTCVGCHGPE